MLLVVTLVLLFPYSISCSGEGNIHLMEEEIAAALHNCQNQEHGRKLRSTDRYIDSSPRIDGNMEKNQYSHQRRNFSDRMNIINDSDLNFGRDHDNYGDSIINTVPRPVHGQSYNSSQFRRYKRESLFSKEVTDQVTISVLLLVGAVRAAVLDPALYLLPGPPITDHQTTTSPWMTTGRALPRDSDAHTTQKDAETTTPKPDMFEASETFWPGLRSIKREVHIPLTFQLTGTYGGYGTGIIGNTYASIIGITGLNGRGKSGLAGSSYGSYYSDPVVKIYGGNNVPAWGGWGNGKWGHYGKG